MEESGWSLVWIPRTKIIRGLLASEPDEREVLLLRVDNDVLDDLDVAIARVTAPELAEVADANRQAIDAYRDGHHLAAQALSTVVFTTIFHTHQGFKTFKDGRDQLSPLDPRDTAIANFRFYCVLRVALLAIERYVGDDDEPIPTRFNRHASAHRLSPEQYTRLNALAALMLITSLICELNTRRGLGWHLATS